MRMAVSLMDGTALMVIGVSSVIPRQVKPKFYTHSFSNQDFQQKEEIIIQT